MGERVVSRTTIVVFGALLVAAGAALAGEPPQAPPRFEIDGRYVFVDEVTGTTFVDGAVAGTPIDLVGDTGLDGEDSYDVRFAIRTGNIGRVRFGFGRVDLDGSGTLDRTVYWQGAMFQAGDDVTSTLRQQYYRAEWLLQFINLGDGVFRAGPILGVHVWKAKVGLSSQPVPEGVRETFNNLAPAVGLAIDFQPHRAIDFYVEGSGFDQAADGWHLEAEGGVRLYFARSIGISAGYRHLEFNVEDNSSPNFARWKVQGPFAGVNVRF